MQLRAFTYYDPIAGLNPSSEARLVLLWMQNWHRHGLVPIVLNGWNARKHRYAREYEKLVGALPTVNPPSYDMACYLRWLAVANTAEPGELVLMLDYDVFVYDANMLGAGFDPNRLNILDPTGVPGAVLGTADQFYAQARRFADYVPDGGDVYDDGRPHVSDMTILKRQYASDPHLINIVDLTREYTDPGWQSAALVHYSNQKMHPAGKIPRWLHIPQLR